MESPVVRKLDSVDWDFTDSRKTGLHSIHPYPAKFIREIPKTLIELFHPGEQSAVFDPFCGSGTTLVEAALAGVPAVGVDLHPLATLIATVKTTIIDVAELKRQGARVVSCAQEAVFEGDVTVPDIPNLDHWFQRHVQLCLAGIKQVIDQVPDSQIANALRVCFSSIIVRVSNQESDTRYAAIDKTLTQDDIWSAFISAVDRTASSLSELSPSLFPLNPRVRILTKDITKATPDEVGNNIGLVVTSPPYPNAYEYWLYHKYRMYWLGMDPISVRNQEIGARPHFFKKNPHTAADFEIQMSQCFRLLSQVMNLGSYACFVIGRSIIKGREIDNEALLVRAAGPYGFRRMASIERSIATNRKAFNPLHGTINKERVIVFLLEGE